MARIGLNLKELGTTALAPNRYIGQNDNQLENDVNRTAGWKRPHRPVEMAYLR